MPETSTPPARTARLRHNGKTLTVYSVVVEARRSSLRPLDLAGAEKAASEALEWLGLCALGHGAGEPIA